MHRLKFYLNDVYPNQMTSSLKIISSYSSMQINIQGYSRIRIQISTIIHILIYIIDSYMMKIEYIRWH